MGGVQAKVEASDIVEEISNIDVRSLMVSDGIVSGVVSNTVEGVHIEGEVTQSATLTMTAANHADAKDALDVKVRSKIDQNIRQATETISQNLNLNPGSTTALNITKSINRTRDALHRDSTTKCTHELFGVISNLLKDSEVTKTGVVVQNIEANLSETDSCIQDIVTKTDLDRKLTKQISQTAKARQEDALSKIFLFLAIIAVTALVSPAVLTMSLSGLLPEPLKSLFGVCLVVGCVLLMSRVLGAFKKSEKKVEAEITDGCGDCAVLGKRACEDSQPLCTWTGEDCNCDAENFPDACGRQCSERTDKTGCVEVGCTWLDEDESCSTTPECRRQTSKHYLPMSVELLTEP